jgi:hypothetical protein
MRTCGQCSECCTTLGVPAIGKAPGERCMAVQDKGGCQVYATRPQECQVFECLWLKGFSKPSSRPDRSGVLIEGQMTALGHTLVVRELREGALSKGKLLKELRKTGQGLWIKWWQGPTSIEGPEKFVAQAKEIGFQRVEGFEARVTLKVLP